MRRDLSTLSARRSVWIRINSRSREANLTHLLPKELKKRSSKFLKSLYRLTWLPLLLRKNGTSIAKNGSRGVNHWLIVVAISMMFELAELISNRGMECPRRLQQIAKRPSTLFGKATRVVSL